MNFNKLLPMQFSKISVYSFFVCTATAVFISFFWSSFGQCENGKPTSDLLSFGPIASMETPKGWQRTSGKALGLPSIEYEPARPGYVQIGISMRSPNPKMKAANTALLHKLLQNHSSIKETCEVSEDELVQVTKVVEPDSQTKITKAQWLPIDGQTVLYVEEESLGEERKGTPRTFYLATAWLDATPLNTGPYTVMFAVYFNQDDYKKYLPIFRQSIATIHWRKFNGKFHPSL